MDIPELFLEINSHTKFLVPITVITLFLIFLIFLFKSRNVIISSIKKNNKTTLYILLVIVFLGLAVRLLLPSAQFVIFNDEPEHSFGASLLINNGNLEQYERSAPLALFIAIPFFLFGITPYVSIWTTLFFGIATIFVVFFIVQKITKSDVAGLFASLIISFHPNFVRWSVTAESNIPGLFFLSVAILTLISLSNKNTQEINFKLLSIGFIAGLFALLIRTEFFLIFIPLVIMIFLHTLTTKKKTILVIFILLSLIALPSVINRISYQTNVSLVGETFKGTASLYAAKHIDVIPVILAKNVGFLKDLFLTKFNPFLITVLAGLSIFHFKYKPKKMSLLFSLFLFLTFFIFLELNKFGGESSPESKGRILMEIQFFLIIFAGIGIAKILEFTTFLTKKKSVKKRKYIHYFLVFILLLILFINMLPSITFAKEYYNNDWSRLETDVIKDFSKYIPENCTLVVRWFSVYGLDYYKTNLISISDFLTSNPNTKTNCYYFIDDVYCKYWGVNKEFEQEPCIDLKKSHSLTLSHTFDADYTYKTVELYKIE